MYRTLLASTALAFSSVTASAETITVCAGGCDYTSINAAIGAASDGDVIQLAAETYFEGAVIDTDGKALTLRGPIGIRGDVETRVIGNAGDTAIRLSGPSTLEMLQVEGSSESEVVSVGFESASTIISCEVVVDPLRSGVSVRSNSNLSVMDSCFLGLVVLDSGQDGDPIRGDFYRTEIANNFGGVVSMLNSVEEVHFSDSRVRNLSSNLTFTSGLYVPVQGNRIKLSNSIVCPIGGGLSGLAVDVRADPDSCIARSCEDLDEDGKIDDCEGIDHTIQETVDAAAGDGIIDLPPGRFRLAAPIFLDPTRFPNGVELRGAKGDEPTTLDGRGSIPLFRFQYLNRGEDELVEPVIDRIQIENGYGAYAAMGAFSCGHLEFHDLTVEEFSGSRLIEFALNWGNTKFVGCRFTLCESETSAGLMFGNRVTCIGCVFEANNLNGPVAKVGSLVLEGCEFVDNSVPDDRAILEIGGSMDATSCVFILPDDTQGAAVSCEYLPWRDGLVIVDSQFQYSDDRRVVIEVGGSDPGAPRHLQGSTFSGCCPLQPMTFDDLGANGFLWKCDGCVGDVTCNQVVNAGDLGRLLSAWDTAQARYDLNEDGIVNAADLGLLLGSWGPCQ